MEADATSIPASRAQRHGARLAERRFGARGRRLEAVRLGFLGELHPLVAGAWDLQRAAAFAIDLGKLAALVSPLVEFAAFGPFPSLRQDLAVTLPDSVAAAEVLAGVRAAAGAMLEDARVFDVYSGEQVGEGRRSLALALSFRALERTLTDEDVEPMRRRSSPRSRSSGVSCVASQASPPSPALRAARG